jgi:hypothetical protein
MRGKRNKIVYIAAEDLKPHPSAQRRLSPAQVKRIMNDLDLDAIGTIHVVEIDDQTWIVDGQHRWSALMRHGFGDWKVRCEIHEDATDHARASALFLRLNNRALVGVFDRWQNEVQAGDPIAVGAKKVAESFGLRVALQKGDGIIACVAALKRIYAIDDGATLKDVLGILADAYGLTSDATEGKLLDGLAVVSSKFNGTLDRPTLTKKLAKYPGGAPSLIGDAKGLLRMRRCSMANAIAEVVIETYNVGRRSENRLTL